MKMDVQRLRNLTTLRLHTEMTHIHEDLATLMGGGALMTHMLPNAMKAVEPWLREHVKDERFWDGEFDTEHTGTVELPDPSPEDRKVMRERYLSCPSPFEGRDVKTAVVVATPDE